MCEFLDHPVDDISHWSKEFNFNLLKFGCRSVLRRNKTKATRSSSLTNNNIIIITYSVHTDDYASC